MKLVLVFLTFTVFLFNAKILAYSGTPTIPEQLKDYISGEKASLSQRIKDRALVSPPVLATMSEADEDKVLFCRISHLKSGSNHQSIHGSDHFYISVDFRSNLLIESILQKNKPDSIDLDLIGRSFNLSWERFKLTGPNSFVASGVAIENGSSLDAQLSYLDGEFVILLFPEDVSSIEIKWLETEAVANVKVQSHTYRTFTCANCSE